MYRIPHRNRHGLLRQVGFSIIELLVVIAILGILAGIAIPSYQKSAMKARRAEAKTTLLDAASRQEQFFLNNKTYTQTVDKGGLNMKNAKTSTTANSEQDFYTISVVAPTTACPIRTCWSMQAVPQGDQTKDTQCGTFKLDSSGTKSAAGSDCW